MRNTTIFPLASHSKDLELDNIASDKSLSHRSVIFALLSNKESEISNFLFGDDTLNSLKIAMQLGIKAILDGCELNLDNVLSKKDFAFKKDSSLRLIPNESGIKEPDDVLDCGNAGTAIRLYMGLLSSVSGYFVLSGDKYLRIRPMSRVIKPLQNIGANISSRANDSLAPITIIGRDLEPFSYYSPISSAQVKSAMILAGLRAKNKSTFSEVSKSRDHSERVLLGMGADLEIENNTITINPLKSPLKPLEMKIPADPSSAFYFAVIAMLLEAKITIKNILLNETRIEAFRVLEKMGANISIIKNSSKYEDIGDLVIFKDRELENIEISTNISWLIDELSALAIIFSFAKGQSVVRNAKELRFKESDRITATITNLKKFGVECEELEDGFIINGGFKISNKKIEIESYGDHRIAMSFATLGTICNVEIKDSECIDVSFPNFLSILENFSVVKNISI